MADETWQRLFDKAQPSLNELFDNAVELVGKGTYDSPIEEMLAVAFDLRISATHLLAGLYWFCPTTGLTVEKAREIVKDASVPGAIFPQVLVGRYRVDFLILLQGASGDFGGIVVECDGHEFHERTKRQATRDKARDRTLQALGYRVMRFTGAEVWADPFKCAMEVLDLAFNEALVAEAIRMKTEREQAATAGATQ